MNYFKKPLIVLWIIFLFFTTSYHFTSISDTKYLAPDTSQLSDSKIPTVLGTTSSRIDKTWLSLPILMYHKTPSDFEQQVQNLISKGYTSITLNQYLKFLSDGLIDLPQKPIIITFDDGFLDQMKAFDILKKYHQQAVFYIFPGSQVSGNCIGIDRIYDESHQCGDIYLNWEQIKQLDSSGIIEIAGHSFDHVNLTTQDDKELSRQILASKKYLEDKLGHPINNFAYPYGYFDSRVLTLVKQYYQTAVTTLPGTIQDFNSPYQLKRVRSAYDLK